FSQLTRLLDRLDSAESFVRPSRAFLTRATGKRRERAAMHGIERILTDIWMERRRGDKAHEDDDFLAEIHASFEDVDSPRRETLMARDVIVLHLGSQSNLYAALAGT